jgi:hypothetical protein
LPKPETGLFDRNSTGGKMANCPECGGEMERFPTKKKGMDILKHKAGQKGENCEVNFIPLRGKKGAVANGNEGAQKTESQKPTNEQTRGGGYRKAVAASNSRGRKKSSSRSNRQGAQPIPQTRNGSSSTGGNAGGKKRGWLQDVTDTIFG